MLILTPFVIHKYNRQQFTHVGTAMMTTSSVKASPMTAGLFCPVSSTPSVTRLSVRQEPPMQRKLSTP